MTLRTLLTRLLRPIWHRMAVAVLLLWGAGLVVAAVQLDAWRSELTRTLVQLNADSQFRTRLARNRDAVHPEWYRRKALSLLAAAERLEDNRSWSLFVPGSWHMFDDLEERLSARLQEEFGDIVVETIRRELYARATRLTGVAPQAGASGLPLGGNCAAPAPKNAQRRLSAAAEDLPEYVAVRDYLRELEELDQAVQAFLAVQRSGTPDPQQLRLLVRYTLGAELPGTLSRSLRFFRDPEEVSVQPALMQAALQWSTQCTLRKGMGALYARLLESNDLLTLEHALAKHSAGLFDAQARPAPFDRTVERYRTVLALLQDQESLLGQGRTGWMRGGTSALGPAHDALLAQIERTSLLGPPVLVQLQGQANAAFAHFRRQFDALFGGKEPGLVWVEAQQRFALAPERVALRHGLAALLQEPFMKEQAQPSKDLLKTAAWNQALGLDEASAWVEARDRFVRESLPQFPSFAQAAVGRVVDGRVAELVYQRAFRALKSTEPADLIAPFDAAAYRGQGERVGEVRALLDRLGARGLSSRLWALHTEPLVKRLALMQQEWEQLALYQPRAADFGWWQGEAAPLWRAFGAADGAGVQRSLTEQIVRLEALSLRAAPLLAAGGPALANDPQAQRWSRLSAELQRWRMRQPDSSLAALERYLLGVGSDLRRDNCAEKLAAQLPPRHDDEISQRYVQLHTALVHRCTQLRAGAPGAVPAVPPPLPPLDQARPVRTVG
jgi:type VI secretion system protein ImpL